MIRLIGDEILLDGVVIATVIPNLTLSLRDKLEEALDCLDEDGETIALLEARVAELEAALAPRVQS